MVPLLKRYVNFSWCGFATENINTRGTKLQTSSQCIYKTSHIFIWLGGRRGLKWLSCGFPPSPSWKVTSWLSTSGSPFPTGFPQEAGGGSLGGAVSSLRAISQQRSPMSCHSSLSARSPRFVCNWCGVLPPRMGSLGDSWGSSSLSGVRGWVPEGSPFTTTMQLLTWAAEGGEVLTLIDSSCKVIALMTPHAMTSISSSSAEWNNTTDLTTENQSTPSGCVCPNQIQISTMFSPCIEAASNRVPLPLVNTRMHIWLRRSTLSFWI